MSVMNRLDNWINVYGELVVSLMVTNFGTFLMR